MLPLIYHHTLKDSMYLQILSVIICIPYEMRIIGGVGKAICFWDVSLYCIPAFGEWLGCPEGNNTQVRTTAMLNLVFLASPPRWVWQAWTHQLFSLQTGKMGPNVGRTSPQFDVESEVKLGRKGPQEVPSPALVQSRNNWCHDIKWLKMLCKNTVIK